MAEQSAWHASVQREDAHKQQQQDGGTAAAAAQSTAAGQAAQPASASASPPPSGLGDLAASMPSLFPSLLSPSPFHHSPSHSIVTLSAAAPSLVPPSPLLSESPSAPQQHQHLGNEHILNNPRLIVNVWQSNLQEELAKILQIVDEYPYIAMVRTRAGESRASAHPQRPVPSCECTAVGGGAGVAATHTRCDCCMLRYDAAGPAGH
jgi:hypothetical protein